MRTAWLKRRIAGNHCLYIYTVYIINHMCFLCIHFRGFRVTCPWSPFRANEQPTCQGVQQHFAYVHTSASKKQGLKCLAVVSCFANRHFNPQRVANRVGILTVWSHCMKGESFAVVHWLFNYSEFWKFYALTALCYVISSGNQRWQVKIITVSMIFPLAFQPPFTLAISPAMFDDTIRQRDAELKRTTMDPLDVLMLTTR